MQHYNCKEWAPPPNANAPAPGASAPELDDNARPLSLPPLNLIASLRVRQDEENGDAAARLEAPAPNAFARNPPAACAVSTQLPSHDCGPRVSRRYLFLIYWGSVPGVIVLHLARCREDKVAFLRELVRSPSNRSVMSAASTASASSSCRLRVQTSPPAGTARLRAKNREWQGSSCPPGPPALQVNSKSRRPRISRGRRPSSLVNAAAGRQGARAKRPTASARSRKSTLRVGFRNCPASTLATLRASEKNWRSKRQDMSGDWQDYQHKIELLARLNSQA
jgi:hypothetical protein